MSALFIQNRSRLFHGHDWVYASDVHHTTGEPQPGSVVTLKDLKNRALGSAIYNPKSQIVARRFSFRAQELDQDFFNRRVQRAWEYRKQSGVSPDLCRVVWSESDGLPGVIVDKYGDFAVLQTLTLAMDQRKEMLVEAIAATLGTRGVITRNDSPIRMVEGLTIDSPVVTGETPPLLELMHGGIPLQANLLEGQKTGLYLDQLDNYHEVAKLAKGRKVLDTFCNQGGFALACALAGAQGVTGVDASSPALALAAANARRAGVEIDWQEANAFDFLKQQEKDGALYDLIILDPPSFTRNKQSVQDAIRGYKEIHLRAMKMLAPGGRLATFTCSHHLGEEDFRSLVRAAAVDARCTLRLTHFYHQRPDHPVHATIPETEYLRGFAFEVMASF